MHLIGAYHVHNINNKHGKQNPPMNKGDYMLKIEDGT